MFSIDMITDNRLASAKKTDMTPLKIDKDSRVAIFAGSGGKIYQTDLNQCTCPDFAIQGFEQPCKHMLRLAMELDEIPADGMQTDIDAARGKYFLGTAREYVKNAIDTDFSKFAFDFSRIALYGLVDDDVSFEASLGVKSARELPFFKFEKNGTATIKKEWNRDCVNLLNVIATRLGYVAMYHASGNRELVDILSKGE